MRDALDLLRSQILVDREHDAALLEIGFERKGCPIDMRMLYEPGTEKADAMLSEMAAEWPRLANGDRKK